MRFWATDRFVHTMDSAENLMNGSISPSDRQNIYFLFLYCAIVESSSSRLGRSTFFPRFVRVFQYVLDFTVVSAIWIIYKFNLHSRKPNKCLFQLPLHQIEGLFLLLCQARMCDLLAPRFSKESLVERVVRVGGMPFLLPPSHVQVEEYCIWIVQHMDALIISGGAFDIDPSHYGRKYKEESIVVMRSEPS